MSPTPDLVLDKERHTLDFRREHAPRARAAAGSVGCRVSDRGREPFEAPVSASTKLGMRLGEPASPIVLASLLEAVD